MRSAGKKLLEIVQTNEMECLFVFVFFPKWDLRTAGHCNNQDRLVMG